MAAVIAERKLAPTEAVEGERAGLLDDGLRAFLHKEIRVSLDPGRARKWGIARFENVMQTILRAGQSRPVNRLRDGATRNTLRPKPRCLPGISQ